MAYPSKIHGGNIRKSSFNNINLYELFVTAWAKLDVETKWMTVILESSSTRRPRIKIKATPAVVKTPPFRAPHNVEYSQAARVHCVLQPKLFYLV